MKPNSNRRGYDYTHKQLRKALLPLAYGQPCSICGETMEKGQELHLDHTSDRTGYRGFAHAECNTRDGAYKVNNKRKRKNSREW